MVGHLVQIGIIGYGAVGLQVAIGDSGPLVFQSESEGRSVIAYRRRDAVYAVDIARQRFP